MRALHPYPAEIERKMKELYDSLNEKDRRRYAAIEAAKLGYGGPAYVSRLWGATSRRFNGATTSWNLRPICHWAECVKKGGRKCCLDSMPGLSEAFTQVIVDYTAGSPTQEGVLWTNLTRTEIASGLAEEGYGVSVTVVDELLEQHDLRQRKAEKSKTMGSTPDRDAQFQHIAGCGRNIWMPVTRCFRSTRRNGKSWEILPGRGAFAHAPVAGLGPRFSQSCHGRVDPAGNL